MKSSVFHSPGASPISKDAKYGIKWGPNGWQIEIIYYIDEERFVRPATLEHEALIQMVRGAKGYDGGSFVINEWSQVVVRDEDGGSRYAGEYTRLLEFDVAGATVSALPPNGLAPGDPWPGPKAGRAYVLAAGGDDIYYQASYDDGSFAKHRLSKACGASEAAKLCRRLSLTKGDCGGRIYLNERRQFFAPVGGAYDFVYLGPLGEDGWFAKPATE